MIDRHLSLLDVAILLGQSDCASLCGAVGCKLSRDGYILLQECLDVDPARRLTAIAAAHEMSAMLWKSQISAKGIAVYQLMKKRSDGKSFPSHLVDVVIAFSLDVPGIVKELDLWEEAHGWCLQSAGWWGALSSSGSPQLEEISIYGEEGKGEGEKADLPPTPVEPSPEPVDEKAMDELMVAMRESRDEVPPLNIDGVRLFRLTSFANAEHVVDLLFDPRGPLKALHDRVKDAGCSLSVID